MPDAIKTPQLIIIGAGAAGFFAAIQAAIIAKNSEKPLQVTLLEAGKTPLGKVKVSGGGRCNVTHNCMDAGALLAHYPRSHRGMIHNFRTFGPQQTIDWFASHGVSLKTEADGRMFPTTDDSQTIIDCLTAQLKAHNIELKLGQPVTTIHQTHNGYTLITPTRSFEANGIILATGGSPKGMALADSLGIETVPPCPSLFTFNTPTRKTHALSGLSVANVTATLNWPEGLKVDGKKVKPLSQTGPLLFTHWGFSGPAILKLSAFGARILAATKHTATLTLDFMPNTHHESLRQTLIALKSENRDKMAKNTPLSGLPKRLWELLITQCNLSELIWRNASNKQLEDLCQSIKHWQCPVSGKGPFKEEFVTAGGIALKALNLSTFAIKHLKNAWGIGEAVNIDGITGGFNFQHAWTSGYIAGTDAARQLTTME